MAEQDMGNWLDDDPEWVELRRRTSNVKLTPKQQNPKRNIKKPHIIQQKTEEQPKKIAVSVNLTLPKVNLPKIPRKMRLHAIKRKQWILMGSIILLVIISAVTWHLRTYRKTKPKDPQSVLSAVQQKPEFKVLAPKDSASAVADDKVHYDSTRKVASFTDTIDNTQVVVSEQPLPESFKDDPEGKTAALAKSINANDVIASSYPKAYLGTSIKGPQTAVFTKNNLLVFIYAPKALDKSAWAEYITKLL